MLHNDCSTTLPSTPSMHVLILGWRERIEIVLEIGEDVRVAGVLCGTEKIYIDIVYHIYTKRMVISSRRVLLSASGLLLFY